MNARRSVRRVLGFLVHNWPLKLAAVALATLLYVGLVATQDSNTYPGPVAVTAINRPAGTVVTNTLRDVQSVRYIAPANLGLLTAEDFRATVNLANVPASGTATNVQVEVSAIDPRVTVLEVRPRTIQVILDQSISVMVPVQVDYGTAPAGIDVGPTTFTPQQVSVTGPSSAVKRVAAVQVNVALDPSGLDYDREVQGTPVDNVGTVVTGVDIEPRTIHVTIPLFTNKQSRTLPVNPVLTGTPAPGFRVSGIEVQPLTVSVEGDADQLAKLTQADTAPVPVFGATRDVASVVTLALPAGVIPLGSPNVTVTVHVTAVTDTRTFSAGFRLDGQDPTLGYSLPVDTVLLTLFGSTADLDRLGSAPIAVGLDVSSLGPGRHQLTVVPSLPSGITVVAIAPATVTVTITAPPTPAPSSPAPSGGSTGPSPSP